MIKKQRKDNGVFYTNNKIASYLVKRLSNDNHKIVLEPSFGDGIFIEEFLRETSKAKSKIKSKKIFGVEIRKDPIDRIRELDGINPEEIIQSDFLELKPFNVDVVIGNPPYIRLNRLDISQRNSAKKILQNYDYLMPINGSLWLPFLLHSISFLKEKGSIGFVLPFEITYVKYARGLWKVLGENFSKITIIRVYEDIFPDVDVETILFIADGFGGKTNFVDYEIFQTKKDLAENTTGKKRSISISSLADGKRPFTIGVLDDEKIKLIEKFEKSNVFESVNKHCKFNIGYVCADKVYFHPNEATIAKFKIDRKNLIPAIPNAKVLKKEIGLWIKNKSIKAKLFYPTNLSDKGTIEYIKFGEENEVNRRFKCRNRKPWFITPDIRQPDLVLSVFGDLPRLFINNSKAGVSNSLLCGFRTNGIEKEILACCWYNSLTILSIETKVHSLGGGVLVLIPGEANQIQVLNPRLLKGNLDKISNKINELLFNNQVQEAYDYGDSILIESKVITRKGLEKVRGAIKELRDWRNSKKRRNGIK